MRKNVLILTYTILFVFKFCTAQKVALIGYNATAPDGISFVALEPISSGTIIYFTENEHQGGGIFNTGEGVWNWIAPEGGITKETIITLVENTVNIMTTNCSSVPCGTSQTFATNIAIASTSESIYAYADTDSNPNNGTTEIYSVLRSNGALPETENPNDFSPNAIVLQGLTTVTHAQYSTENRSASLTTKEDLENPENYTQSSGNQTLDTTSFNNINLLGAVENLSVGLPIKTETSNITVVPNPSNQYIRITGLKKTQHYRLYNQLGQEIDAGTISMGQNLDISPLANGVYSIVINNSNVIKFIKK